MYRASANFDMTELLVHPPAPLSKTDTSISFLPSPPTIPNMGHGGDGHNDGGGAGGTGGHRHQ